MNVWHLSLPGRLVLLGITLASFVLPAYANSVPPPHTVHITDVTFSGTGCPSGSTVQAEISDNQRMLRLILPTIMAEAGPSVPRESQRRICTVILNVEHPAGWQFTIRGVKLNGMANLEDKVEGSVLSSFFFQGDSTAVRFENTLTGPFTAVFRLELRSGDEQLGSDDELFGPCGGGRSLVMGSEARVNPQLAGENAMGQIFLGQEDTAVLSFGLMWREC